MMRKFVEVELEDSLFIRVMLTIFTTVIPFFCGYFYALTRIVWFMVLCMVPLLFEIERKGGRIRVYV
jgi:hypothetical protein